MQKKKNVPTEEPILSAVARRLGRAAGTLAKITQEVTGGMPSPATDASAGLSKSAKRKPLKKRGSATKSKQRSSS